MKQEKGFTLIELLAVIVILAVIALIATPLAINVIENARKNAFKNTAYGLIDAVKLQYAENYLNGNTDDLFYTFPEATGLSFSGERPKGGTIRLTGTGKISLAVYNDKWCAVKSLDTSEVTLTDYEEGKCILQEEADVPIITLNGEKIIYLNIGKNYVEPGYSVKTVGGEVLSNDLVSVSIIGQTTGKTEVDTSIEEIYTITYAITYKEKTDIKTRIIHVGNYKPAVQIEPNETNGYAQETEVTINVSAFEQYSIDGFSYVVTKDGVVGETIAVDSLSKQISLTEDGTYQIKVNATDSEGNTNEYTSGLYNIDVTDPVITFTEGDVGLALTSTEATSYDLKTGVTVTDNNEITINDIEVSGEISSTANEYTITYTATDIAGNTSTKTRKITVLGTTQWTFTSDGTFTVPATGTYTIEMHGGGGGGSGGAAAGMPSDSSAAASGGGGGGSGETYTTLLTKGETYAITIGAGGAGGARGYTSKASTSISIYSTAGSSGGATTFGSLYSVAGGGGGGRAYAYALSGSSHTELTYGSGGSASGSLAKAGTSGSSGRTGGTGGSSIGNYGTGGAGGSASSNGNTRFSSEAGSDGQPGAVFITFDGSTN